MAAAPDLRVLADSGDRHGQSGPARFVLRRSITPRAYSAHLPALADGLGSQPAAMTWASCGGIGRCPVADVGTPSLQRRVQFAILLQLAEYGTADRVTTAAMCPSVDERDLKAALENLLDEGSIEGVLPLRGNGLVDLAAAGFLTLTVLGRLRLDEDDV